MYIMKLFGMTLEDAFEFVKSHRDATDPNDGFLEQLKNFEENNFQFPVNEDDTDDTGSPILV